MESLRPKPAASFFGLRGKELPCTVQQKNNLRYQQRENVIIKKRGGKQMRRKSIPVFEDAASGQEYVKHLLKQI